MVKPYLPQNANSATAEKIIAAAREIFTAKGLDGARMQDIADAAGINKALLHYYFRSKEGLFQIVFQEHRNRLLGMLLENLRSPLPLREKIPLMVSDFMVLLRDRRQMPLFVLAETSRKPELLFPLREGSPVIRQTLVLLRQQLETEAAEGLIRPVSVADFVLTFMSLCLFPFVAGHLLTAIMNMDDAAWEALLQTRQTEITRVLIASIQPDQPARA